MEVPSYYTAPSPAPRISEWFSESFNLFGREWKTWTLQGLIYVAVSTVPALPGIVLYYVALARMMAQISAGAGSASGAPPVPAGLFASIGVLTAGGCVSSLLGVYLLAGMTRTAVKQLRGEPIGVGDLFTAADVLLPDLGAYVFGTLVLSLAFGFCFLPGLWLMGLWLFVHPLIVERRLSISEAFRESSAITRPHIAMYILWAMLILVVLYAGGMIVIGTVATLPIAVLMWVVSYRDASGLPGAVTAAPPATAPVTGYIPDRTAAVPRRCPHCERAVDIAAQTCPSCGASLPPA
jgi:hypothetical protein